MRQSEKPRADKHERTPKLSRSEEARQIIEEYANDLREIIRKIIKKLRRDLN
jgi:hypothetical protein